MVGDVRDLHAPGPGPGICRPLNQGQGPAGLWTRVRDLQAPGPGSRTCRSQDQGQGRAGPWTSVGDMQAPGQGSGTCRPGTSGTRSALGLQGSRRQVGRWRPADLRHRCTACSLQTACCNTTLAALGGGACGLSKHTTGRRTTGHTRKVRPLDVDGHISTK